MKQIHESKHGVHFGVTRTVSRVRQHYDWPNLRQTVKDVLGDCDTCHKTKASRHKPYGMLEPLPVPGRPWGSITMDFVVKLPRSKDPVIDIQYDSIWVVVDRLTK